MEKKFIYFIVYMMMGPSFAFATGSCDQFNTSKDILDCALENHPNLIRGKKALLQANSFEDKASQIPNPELDVKLTYGESFGDQISNNEIDLPFTIETGGKRSGRIEKALAEKEQVAAEFLKTREDVYIYVSKTLHRIGQVHSEMKILEEALETFSKIQRQYKSRPTLGPEQEVSLSLFQLAEGDYKIRKSALEIEENTLEKNIGIAIGKEFPHKETLLPSKITNWPDFSSNSLELKGSDIKLPEAELKIAQAGLELAKSESWPDLKIGPTVQKLSEGGFHYWVYGINLSIPLPFFNVNGGGRDVARAGLLKSERSLELRKRELTQYQSILLNQYQNSVRSLKDSLSLSELQDKHKSVEKQFARGVIPSSLVIEAHRQMIDFAESQNKQVLITLESLQRLKALEGSLLEE